MLPRKIAGLLRYASLLRRRSLNRGIGAELAEQSRLRVEGGRRTDYLVNFPAAPRSLPVIRRWLPVLERLHRVSRVSIITGDVLTYRAVTALTDIPCYLGFGAGQPEYIAQQLQTRVMLYLEQSRFNLREAGFHDIFHVFLGSPGAARAEWLNNRLRLFDYVLVPDRECVTWLARRLMDFDVAERVRTVGSAPPAPAAGSGAPDPATPVDRLGVETSHVLEALAAIATERDRAVAGRDAELAAQGIVLRKGGEA